MNLNEMLKEEVNELNLTDVKFISENLLEVGCGIAVLACGSGGNNGEG